MSGLNSVGFTTAPLASLLSIITLIATGEQITAFAMFTILSCLNVINDSVTMAMGFSLPYVAEGYIAVKRIEKFMLRQFGLTSALFAKQDRRLKRKGCSTAVFRPESFRSGDTKLHSVSKTPTKIDTEKNGLSMVRVSASWDRREDRRALTNVTFFVSQGEMLAVTGPVGSGKSSLLMAILGELPTISGTVAFNGTVAYVPQIPWVFSGTVRDIILFG